MAIRTLLRRTWMSLTLLAFLLGSTHSLLAQDPLTQTYTSDDGIYTIQHPAGWTFGGGGGMLLGANGSDLNITIQPMMQQDQLALMAFALSALGVEMQGMPVDMILTTLLPMALSSAGAQNWTYSDVEAITVAGKTAATLSATTDTQQARIWAVDFGGDYVLASVRSGNLSQFEVTIEAMLETLTLQNTGDSSIPGDESPFADAPEPIAGTDPIMWQLQTADDGLSLFSIFQDIEIDGTDRLYVADGWNGVWVLNADGEVETLIPRSTDIFSVDEIAVTPDGTVWVANPNDNEIVQLDQGGNIVARVGEKGAGAGQFSVFSPSAIEADQDGNVYAFDGDNITGRGRVEVFNSTGEFVREFDVSQPDLNGFISDVKLAVYDGYVFAADPRYGLRFFDQQGHLIIDYGLEALSPLTSISGLAATPSGMLFVLSGDGVMLQLDWNFGQVSRYDGTWHSDDAERPFELGEFYAPPAAAFLSNGDVVILDRDEGYGYAQLVRLHVPVSATVVFNPPTDATQEPTESNPAQAPTESSPPSADCANAPAPRLSVSNLDSGDLAMGQVIPNTSPNVVRDTPAGANVVGQLMPGVVFRVLDGPVCGNDGRWWWWVDSGGNGTEGVRGWTAEGEGSTYWLEPVSY